LKDRVSALRYLPRFFGWCGKAVPHDGGQHSIAHHAVSYSAAMLYVAKLIIDGIVHLKDADASHNHLWNLVAVEFGLAILSDVLSRALVCWIAHW
jgi:ATP-binding cassette subfamily B protein